MPMINEINLKVNVTYGDGSLSDHSTTDTHLVMFIFWGVILPLIATAGLVGNILTIIVLWRKEMQSTTILYLRALVITDTGILIGSVITLTPLSCANYLQGETLGYFKDAIYPNIHTPGYYVVMALQQCNVWITVSVSMERYIAICHPFRAARLITRRKTIIVMVVIAVVSLLYNIPHLLATKTIPCKQFSPAPLQQKHPDIAIVNDSSVGGYGIVMSQTPSTTTPKTPDIIPECLEVSDTEFGNTAFYKSYRTIMYSITIYVIPFLALLFLNIFLIKELMTMQRRRSGTNIHDENEANLSLVLVLIVIVFIFCQTPGLISQFDLIPVEAFFYWLAVSNVLFTTNSAVNFLIYTAFGRKFRKVLLRVFRHFFTKKRRPSMASMRMTQYTTNDFDTCDATETHCSTMRAMSCYKTDCKSNGQLNETIPLNTKRESVSSKKRTSANGIITGMNGNNNGSKPLHVSTPLGEENGKKNHQNGTDVDNMETVPLASYIKDDVSYKYYNQNDDKVSRDLSKTTDNHEHTDVINSHSNGNTNGDVTNPSSNLDTEQVNNPDIHSENDDEINIHSNSHTVQPVGNGKEK